MNFDTKSIAIGVAAGIAAALLSVGSVAQTALSLVLFFVAPLPVMVAGLGWGPAAGIAAVATAFLGVAGFASVLPAIVVAAAITIPAAAMAYFASLARPMETGGMDWYPLSGVLFRTAILVAAGFVLIGVIVGYDAEFIRLFADEVIRQLQAADPQAVITDANKESLRGLLGAVVPFLQPATWMLVLLANFYAALHVARLSGRLARPRDFWPRDLRLPRAAITILAAALALTFVGGTVGAVAAVPAGAFMAAFIVTGVAYFHASTAGRSWRMPALWAAYLSIILVGFPVIVFLFAGFFAAAKPDNENSG